MRDRSAPTLRRLLLPAAIIIILYLAAASAAHADVVGRLHFIVKNGDTDKPIAGAKITLHDTAGVLPDVPLTTDTQGSATSPPLAVRDWQVTTTATDFHPDTQTVTVVADAVTDKEILLDPLKETTIKITGQKETINRTKVSNSTTVNVPNLITKYPVLGGDPLSLRNLLLATPGVAQDSVGQGHPRGEHNAVGINLNGAYIPSALAGRIGSILAPDAIQNLDVLTGGFAPEYGGETAAVLNITLRAGTKVPFANFSVEGGSYNTYDGSLTFGGQLGSPIGAPDSSGHVARRFGYLIDLAARRTDLALEPPQPDNQTAHNSGATLSGFGNFTYTAGPRDEFNLVLNSTPASTQIANRTGLPAAFASVGQGFGYTGHLSAADAAAQGIGSQQADGQDINQRDVSDLGFLYWRHTFSPHLNSLFSFGIEHNGQDVTNHNPVIDLTNLLPDNSIEYNPTIIRNSHHVQPSGSATYTVGRHTFKIGILDDEQEGDETYQLIPGSQLALDDLAGIGPNLAPAGTLQVDANGNPVLDSLGHQVYQLTPGTTATPIVHVHRVGYYRAAYAQDTTVAGKAAFNYGVRLDWYAQNQNLGQASVDTADISPRLNFSYEMLPQTIWRISYDRLFIQPPLAQGAILGRAILPETLNQYDTSIEHQIDRYQTIKLAYYIKDIRNQIDTGLLIPFTQIGVFSTVNWSQGNVHGVELSYQLTPRNNVGFGSYFNYTYSIAKPNGTDNLGNPAPLFNDHDQLNTIDCGVDYTFKSQANIAATVYYGSGVASSVVFPTDALGNGPRTQRTQVNLSLSSGPRLFPGKHGGVALNIENVFDDRPVVNFNSGFSGTRFQEGRRILLSAFGNF